MTAGEIARLIAGHRYEFATEAELQDQISGVLARAGVQAEREVRLDKLSRLDFLAGSIAIEVKIGSSRPQLLSQIHRYAQDTRISAIIVVSRKARHLSMPAFLNGKEIHVASLMGSAF
jgi:hypothetical protein